MSGFVEVCRKEWKRLGVPEAVAEEMAADLAADLAEAQAEGASAEAVLGNAVFDARSFASSWARARGVGQPHAGLLREALRSSWALAAAGLASLFLVAVGIAAVTTGHSEMAISAVRRSINLPGTPPFGPRNFTFIGPFPPGRGAFLVNNAVHPIGWVVLAVGLVGLGLTAWLWRRRRPWTTRGGGSGLDDGVAMPSYL